jgi:hypothetical protein
MTEQQPEQPAPDPNLRSARERLQQAAAALRKALDEDDRRSAEEERR